MTIQTLCEQVKQPGRALRIRAGDSKVFLGTNLEHLGAIDVRGVVGVVSYEPSELVIQVRAGTSLAEVITLLDGEQQMLAFDPPVFDGKATIGGMVASGIPGSRRPYVGSVRDFVLGIDLIDGRGDLLSFGGQVMKNVAGYDVSRLMVGAMGCLGIITEVSFKVLPKPELERTLVFEMSAASAHKKMLSLRKLSHVSACAWYLDCLYIRLSGMEEAIAGATSILGGETASNALWQQIDNLSIFPPCGNLWRVSITPNHRAFIEQATLIDWAGGQRWLVDPAFNPRHKIGGAGHATLIRGYQIEDKFQPLSAPLLSLHRGLKQQFDPQGRLNPHKMFAAF